MRKEKIKANKAFSIPSKINPKITPNSMSPKPNAFFEVIKYKKPKKEIKIKTEDRKFKISKKKEEKEKRK